jgi:hypothetical protein
LPKPLHLLAIAALSFASLVAGPARADSTIVIVRHAEKPAQGLGQLSCQGFNRALALAPLLLSRYGTPVAIYAPNPGVKKRDQGVDYAYVRPLATIEPLAVRVGMPVDLDSSMSDIGPLADRILAAPPGTQFVAWEHHLAESLARSLLQKLGADPSLVPHWKNADYDSIYVVHVAEDLHGARRASFSLERQGLDGQPQVCSDGPQAGHP